MAGRNRNTTMPYTSLLACYLYCIYRIQYTESHPLPYANSLNIEVMASLLYHSLRATPQLVSLNAPFHCFEQEVIITNNNLLLHFSGHNNDLLVLKQWKGA